MLVRARRAREAFWRWEQTWERVTREGIVGCGPQAVDLDESL